MQKIAIFSFVLMVNLSLFSQWNSNTNINTVVCDTTGEQNLVKCALCPDGTSFYTWFDQRVSGYAVYIQRLDMNGNRMFPAGGILVSNNPQNTSLVDYDLAADASGNAIVVFTDIRNSGSINPFAYMISPAGTMLWGANGVTLSDSVNSFQPNPKIACTSDGNYVFLWRCGSGPTKLCMQKLNAAGVKQWGAGPVYFSSGSTENFDWPAIIPSDAGNTVIMWSGYTGSFISPSNYKIYSQKISPSGAHLWSAAQDTVVYSLGRVSGFYTPRLFSDGLNGAIYCWRDDRNAVNLVTGYVHRKNSAGTFLFPVNGSPVSTLAGNNHFDPVAAYMPATGETVAFWYESNSAQSQYGVYGQKFSSNGTSLWGASGIAFSPLGSSQPSAFNTCVFDTNAFCYFQETAGGANYLTKAFRVGKSGGFVWPGNILVPGSLLSPKIRLNAVINSGGMSILSWTDQRNDYGIYAQNIRLDGGFGLTGINQIGTEIPNNFTLSQNYPNPFNPVTKIKFSLPSVRGAQVVMLVVYDAIGREVEVLVNEQLNPGTYEVKWNADKFSSAVYYYKIVIGDYTETKKMLLIK